MSIPPYQIRQCGREECHFRFPVTNSHELGEQCPHCGSPTILISSFSNGESQNLKTRSCEDVVEALLDNIRSVYNVGSIFRTADGAGIKHLHLCGITTTPEHPKVVKTALGAEQMIPWTQYRNGFQTAVSLKEQGYRLWAIEAAPQAVPLFEINPQSTGLPIVLVVGNEVSGIDPDILAMCDQVLWIPMQGSKRSLNVAVAFGIAAYFLRYTLSKKIKMTALE